MSHWLAPVENYCEQECGGGVTTRESGRGVCVCARARVCACVRARGMRVLARACCVCCVRGCVYLRARVRARVSARVRMRACERRVCLHLHAWACVACV